MRAGRDFGKLVREQRRQRGPPLPVADKVLPFRTAIHDVRALPGDGPGSDLGNREVHVSALESRIIASFLIGSTQNGDAGNDEVWVAVPRPTAQHGG